MNYGTLLSLVSALAMCCGVLGSITAFDRAGFGASAAYAGEADAPAATSNAQPASAGSRSASGTVGAPAKKLPDWYNPALVFTHPIVIGVWRGRDIKVPHDSDLCAQAVEYAMAGEEVPIDDAECRAVIAQVLNIYRTEPIPPAAPQKFHGSHLPYSYIGVGANRLLLPDDRGCKRAIYEALSKHATVPAPYEKCRAIMLKALEIQRNALNAPPEVVTPNIGRVETAPLQHFFPEESAPGQPGAEGYVPNPADSEPPP